MTPAQITLLGQELTTDPRQYGYATRISSGDDQGIANLLNMVRDGSAGTLAGNPLGAGPGNLPAGLGTSVINVRRNDIRPVEIFQAVALADMIVAPTEAMKLWWNGLANVTTFSLVDPITGADTLIKTNLAAIVTGTTSKNRLVALSTRVGSRAEEMFGMGTFLTTNDVALALGRG